MSGDDAIIALAPRGCLAFERLFGVGLLTYDQLVELSVLRLACEVERPSYKQCADYRRKLRVLFTAIMRVGEHRVRLVSPARFPWFVDDRLHTDVCIRFELLCASLLVALAAETPAAERQTLLKECAAHASDFRIRRHGAVLERRSVEAMLRGLPSTRDREPLVLWVPLYDALAAALDDSVDASSVAGAFIAFGRRRDAAKLLVDRQPLVRARQRASSTAWRLLAQSLVHDHARAALAIACARIAVDEDSSDEQARDCLATLERDNATVYHETSIPTRADLTLVFDRERAQGVYVDGGSGATSIVIGLQ